MNLSPTPYKEVNEILNLLLNNVKEILQDQLIGMYLFGSLANGSFDDFSDVDVLIVTDKEIPDETFSTLKDMHQQIQMLDNPWANQMEVSYIPQAALRRFDPTNNLHPHVDRGTGETLFMMHHASDWITQRFILRERGIIIHGPAPSSLIDPIHPNELRQAVIDVLPLWTNPILDNPSEIKKRGYQSYCVLTLCRMLYTLQNKDILSKPEAATWAMKTLDTKWKPLIERAIIGRQSPGLDADKEDIDQTLEMMRYVTECAERPSIFPEINQVLHLLHANAKEILGEQFVGMYLYGSLSSGDFNPESSDIDFLFVTESQLDNETISHLETMHKQTWASSLQRAGELEGAYVPKSLIRKHNPNGVPCPTINEGKFYMAPLGSDWIIQRHVVREYGIIIEGPDPKKLIDFVTPEDISGAVMGTLHEWWFPMLNDPSWLRDYEVGYRSFAVITMCRVLHALETGTITSKPKAAAWTKTKLGEPWIHLIDKALAVINHEEQDISLDETLDFIRFIKGHIVDSHF